MGGRGRRGPRELLTPGCRVSHPRFGPGTVLRLLDGGRKTLVRFERQPTVPYVLPVEQFTRDDPAPVPPPPRVPAALADTDDPPDRQSLEALRLGVVPRRGLRGLTVGRHHELAAIDGLVADARGMLVVSGGYGSGKTHLIELAEARALDNRLLVARATFDPVEVPPSHPLRIYGALMSGLRYPDRAGAGLRPLLEQVPADDAHLTGDGAHRWLSPALFAVHGDQAELADDVLEFVSGRVRDDHRALSRALRRSGFAGQPMLGLPDYRTFGQILAHLLGGVAAWARDAGYRGLLVLLDEAEYLDRLGAVSRELAENVLRYLALASLDDGQLAFAPDAVYRGGHAVHKAISPRFQDDQPLGVLCAFTPNPQVDSALRRTVLDPSCRLRLEPVRPSLLPVLAERVLGMVMAVHPELDPEPAHRERVTRALSASLARGEVETTRAAARLVVEFWDLYRRDPLRALAALAPG